MNWIRIIEGTTHEIGSNNFVHKEWNEGERYTVEIDQIDGLKHVIFRLKIENSKSSDNGPIGCRTTNRRLMAVVNLEVLVDLKELDISRSLKDGSKAHLYAESQALVFKEGEVYNLACHASGSMPAPHMRMMLGDEDVSHEFELTKELKTSMPSENKPWGYDVTMRNKDWQVTYKYARAELKCIVDFMNDVFPSRSLGINITLSHYKPQFECPTAVMLPERDVDVRITCIVHANPEITDASFSWEKMTEKTDLIQLKAKEGERQGHYTSELIDGDDEQSKVMTLKLERIFSQQFRNYTFYATNELGTTSHIIRIIKDPKVGPSSPAPVPTSSIIFSLVSFAVVIMLK